MQKKFYFSLINLAFLLGCNADLQMLDEKISSVEQEDVPNAKGDASDFFDRPLSVFVIDNLSEKNSILTFRRDADGALQPAESFPTGGLGSGDALGSQGSLAISDDRRWLFAVNAGSNEISSFEIQSNYLILRDIVSSGGVRPISLALRNNVLYVLNAGNNRSSQVQPGNISGFNVYGGQLTPIADSTRSLSSNSSFVDPAQVGFAPNKNILVVTEKATNLLTTYLVNEDNTPYLPIVTNSHGQTPFGFAFDGFGTLIVSEATGGEAEASTVSSYRLSKSGIPMLISGSVPTEQTAACWVAISYDRQYAYTTNTGSNSISGFFIHQDGTIERFGDGGQTAMPGDGPIDMAFTQLGKYLYVLNGQGHTIAALRFLANGKLGLFQSIDNLPPSAVGIAVSE